MKDAHLQKLLLAKAGNIYSQHGEDGIIEAIFDAIGETNRWCLEVGAFDGIRFSNTRRLVGKGWKGVLIEGDSRKYALLCKMSPDCHCVLAQIKPVGENSLDAILGRYKSPKILDLISIDIDGQEYHIWDKMEKYSARVVVIEHCYSVKPGALDFIVPLNGSGQSGRRAIQRLAESKGYTVVAVTPCNSICVENSIMRELEIYYASN